ncbi:MAG: hypothetical protein ACI4LA_06375 [Emergencia sp.]
MKLKIEKESLGSLNLDTYRDECGQALDSLWESEWIQASITRRDREMLEPLQDMADKLSNQSDAVVFLACGQEARLIEAVAGTFPGKSDRAEVIVFGDTLSASDYERLFSSLDGRDYSIVAVSAGEEPVPLRGAFVSLKKLLIQKYGQEAAAERILAMAGKKSRLLAEDAMENDYPLLRCSEDIPARFGAGTGMALLPLAIRGGSMEEYLDGFYDMLASPAWDTDGADYSAARAVCRREKGFGESIHIWQSQLCAFGKWMECSGGPLPKRMLAMPSEQPSDCAESFASMFCVEYEDEDLMMPFFEGCNEDGSLNLLLAETAGRYFSENAKERPGVKISVERLDSYTLGHLTAFVQLSNGITDFLLKK